MDKLNRLLFLGPVISRLPKAHCQRTLPALSRYQETSC